MIEFKRNRASLVVFLALLFGVMFLAIIIVQPYLLSLVMGAILALLCRPLYLKLRGKGKHSKFASISVTAGLVLAVMIPSVLMILLALQEGISIAKALSNDDHYSVQKLVDQLAAFPLVKKWFADPASIEKQIREGVQAVGQAGSALILTWISHVPAFFVQFILTALSCCFFLMDGARFFRWVIEKIPLDQAIRRSLTVAFKETSISVIWATFFASAAQSTIIFFTFIFLGVPAPFLAAGATFLLAWIPMVGSSPVWIPASLFLLFTGATIKAPLMVILGLSTGIVDNTIRAVILKGRSQMHPLVSLMAIFGGIQMFGLFGVFLGPIIAAILITLIEVWPVVGKRYGLLEPLARSTAAHSARSPAGKGETFSGHAEHDSH